MKHQLVKDVVTELNTVESLKAKLKDHEKALKERKEELINTMKAEGKTSVQSGWFKLSLTEKEKFSLPESKSPMRKKLGEILSSLGLLEVCSNLYSPKVKKVLKDPTLSPKDKELIESYTITEVVYDLKKTIEPVED
jgi:hypothetical protein